jgi:hypothetical protein
MNREAIEKKTAKILEYAATLEILSGDTGKTKFSGIRYAFPK